MEELRRNAMSSLGKHEEQSEYTDEDDYETDKTKTVSPSQVREVKEKKPAKLPKYLEKKLNSTERKLRKQSERHAISTDDDLHSSPEDSVIGEPFLGKEQLDKRRKNGNGKLRLQAMKATRCRTLLRRCRRPRTSSTPRSKTPGGAGGFARHFDEVGADARLPRPTL